MIDLTPLEVRKKKGDFKRALRGYDASLVDDFLDLVADRLEELVRGKMAMEERLRALEGRLAEFTSREKGLTDALVSAQEMREETRAQVIRETELARREAEADAERIRQAAHRDREREEDTLRRLRARQRQLVNSYRTFLERELSELDVIHETLELQGREAGRLPAPGPDDELELPLDEDMETAGGHGSEAADLLEDDGVVEDGARDDGDRPPAADGGQAGEAPPPASPS